MVYERGQGGQARSSATVSENVPALTPAGPERAAEIEPRGWTTGRTLSVLPFPSTPRGSSGVLRYPLFPGEKKVVVSITYHSEM